MEENYDNTLEVVSENGSPVKIRVYDIIDENPFNKEFIIYTLVGEDSTLFASILNETESSYSLNSITSEEELRFVNSQIQSILNDIEEEE